MKNLGLIGLFFLLSSAVVPKAEKDVILTRFNRPGKSVALTFDACESRTPAFFDTAVLNFLVRNHIQATIFLSGKFANRNAEEIRQLKRLGFIEFENHSMHHYQHMEKLPDAKAISEVTECQKLIRNLTGKEPKYFRFPAGNYDERKLHIVDSLGLKVVHWTFASGDPDEHITAERLETVTLERTKPGDILIFHINGRGWHTGEALPVIYSRMKAEGYSFISLSEALHPQSGGKELRPKI